MSTVPFHDKTTVERLAHHPRYQMLRQLGDGGMGTVFLARHLVLDRFVAIKLVRADCLNDAGAVERFRREVKAAAALNHPNVVTVYDADQVGGAHFLVMEYVEGDSLRDWLAARGPRPPAEAASYVRQAALGLQHAHERGLVHRDLKPHNLMRTPAGTIKILDFGLARFTREADAPPAGPTTASGVVMGTADYMAPEQARDCRSADIRADVYSLGCTLYELLTGRAPFPEGTFVDKVLNHATLQAEPLDRLRPDLPPGLAVVVARMMAKSPAQRYQTPAEVAAALDEFATPSASSATRIMPQPSRRPRRVASLALLGALVVLAAGVPLYIVLAGGNKDTPTGVGETPAKATAPEGQGRGGPLPNGRLLFADDFTGPTPRASPLFPTFTSMRQGNGTSTLTATHGGVLPVMYEAVKAKDFYAEFECRVLEPREGYSYGLLFRSSDVAVVSRNLTDYYGVFVTTDKPGVGLMRWHNARWEWLKEVEVDPARTRPDVAHKLRVEAVGADFRVFLDGEAILQQNDRALAEAGIFGLVVNSPRDRTMEPHAIQFRQFRVWLPAD